jgi:hypothetical protein
MSSGNRSVSKEEITMAKVNFNPWLDDVRGAYGRLVFRKRYGKVNVSRKAAPSELPSTAAQTAHRLRFKEAAAYAGAVMKDALLRQPYLVAAKARNTNPFGLALADFMGLPKVTEVDLAEYHGQVGDPIRVRASDDFGLVAVTVTIRTEAGATVEQGLAVNEKGIWVYRATTVAPVDQTLIIEAGAKDRADHEQTLSEQWHA